MKLIGFSEFPCIAYGRVFYISREAKLAVDKLLKPSPFQALTAILAALMNKEKEALFLAVRICRQFGILPKGDYTGPDGTVSRDEMSSLWASREIDRLSVHVLEDSPIGIQSCQGACQLLQELGFEIELHLWGIAKASTKVKALRDCGATIFDRTDDAIQFLLSTFDEQR